MRKDDAPRDYASWWNRPEGSGGFQPLLAYSCIALMGSTSKAASSMRSRVAGAERGRLSWGMPPNGSAACYKP